MTTLRFTNDQILSWAHFSGDYNPIHFDASRAKEAGASDIMVHGMLALLDIKQQLTDLLNPVTGHDWVVIKTMFRSPVIRQSFYTLEIQKGEPRYRFSLRTAFEAMDVITGSVYRVPPAKLFTHSINPAKYVSIDGGCCAEKRVLFVDSFPDFEHAWLLTDSLSFFQFLITELGSIGIQKLEVLEVRGNQYQVQSKALAMQTTNTVAIDPVFFQAPLTELSTGAEIQCELYSPVIITDVDRAISGRFFYNVRIDGRLVMQSEIGLLLRPER